MSLLDLAVAVYVELPNWLMRADRLWLRPCGLYLDSPAAIHEHIERLPVTTLFHLAAMCIEYLPHVTFRQSSALLWGHGFA